MPVLAAATLHIRFSDANVNLARRYYDSTESVPESVCLVDDKCSAGDVRQSGGPCTTSRMPSCHNRATGRSSQRLAVQSSSPRRLSTRQCRGVAARRCRHCLFAAPLSLADCRLLTDCLFVVACLFVDCRPANSDYACRLAGRERRTR